MLYDVITIIKGMIENGERQNVLSRRFCVSEMQVSRIARKENWAEVEPTKVK